MRRSAQLRLPRRAAVALGGAALALPFIARPARADVVRWTFYTAAPQGSPGAEIWQNMASRISVATLGAVEIAVATAGRVGVDVNAISQAVTAGQLAMGDDSYYAQFIVAGGVPRLPLLIPNRDAYKRGTKALRTYLKNAYDARNGVFLAYTYTPRLRTWSSRSFDSFAGLLNRRIRVTTPEQGEFTRRLGGIPISVPTADLLRSLQSGHVDTIYGFANPTATLFRTLLKYAYAGGPNHMDSVIIAHKPTFQALPKRTQDLIIQECATAEQALINTVFDKEDESIRFLADNGLDLAEQQTVDVQTMTQRMAVMWDDWTRVRGKEAQDLLFAFRRAMEAE